MGSRWDIILLAVAVALDGWLVSVSSLATQYEVKYYENEMNRGTPYQSLCSAHIPLYFIILAILNLMIFYGYALWIGHMFPYYLFPKKVIHVFILLVFLSFKHLWKLSLFSVWNGKFGECSKSYELLEGKVVSTERNLWFMFLDFILWKL